MALVGIVFLALFAWNAFRMVRMFKHGRVAERTARSGQLVHERNLYLDLRSEIGRSLDGLD